MHTGLWWRDSRERGHLEDLDLVGRIIINLQEVGWGGIEWIGVAQDSDRRRAVLNATIKCGEFLD